MGQCFIVRIEGQGAIELPLDVRQRLHLDEPGAQVEVSERPDGVIELRPQTSDEDEQGWFWDDHWQEGERRVDAHVKAGEIIVSSDIDAFLADLDVAREQIT